MSPIVPIIVSLVFVAISLFPSENLLSEEYAPKRADNYWDYCGLDSVVCENEKIFEITGFNTVPEQTDSSPCISASGDNICGRDDVVACPREYPFGTIFVIDGKDYVCLDRTAKKYNNRLDISFDKDIIGAIQFGKQTKQVIIK